MRKLLLFVVSALLIGAGLVWILQFGTGYILFSFDSFTVEMSVWTGLLIYLLATAFLCWLLLTLRWVAGVGGLRLWWRRRRAARSSNLTSEGLQRFADADWQHATDLLSQSADKSAMPVVNLLFAARSAAENNQINQARQIYKRLKTSYPKAHFQADKGLAELLLLERKPSEAILLLQSLYAEKPTDRGLLRLLADAYYMAENWRKLQKILRDLKRYKAIGEDALLQLECDVYGSLLDEFTPDSSLSLGEQRDQLEELWYNTPKKLHKHPDIIAGYVAGLSQVGAQDKAQAVLIKALNNQWDSELVRQFGLLASKTPEKQVATAEKWLVLHPKDADLILALGLICDRAKLFGKARDYLSQAIKLRPSVQAYVGLAGVLEHMGETRASADTYRRGLLFELEERNAASL